MTLQILTRQRPKAASQAVLTDAVSFVHGRVHELCGPSRRSLAIMIASKLEGPVLWIRPAWTQDRVAADGVAPWLNPARIVFLDARSVEDLLWCTEEALRSGAAPMVITELPEPPALTPVRRLHLAAQAAKPMALAMLLTPEDGGAQGVETRWHMAPAHEAGQQSWQLTRLRARMEPPASWCLRGSPAALIAA